MLEIRYFSTPFPVNDYVLRICFYVQFIPVIRLVYKELAGSDSRLGFLNKGNYTQE